MSTDPTACRECPTPEDARVSLSGHVAGKGADLRRKYGARIGWPQLQLILADRDFVRYPCEIAFDAGPLQPDECAYPEPLGDLPEDGFRLCVHPYFAVEPDRVPLLALYQLVAVNYGAFASPADAEVFGAAALGMAREQYYNSLCAMADEIAADDAVAESRGCGCEDAPAEGLGKTCARLPKECSVNPETFRHDDR